MFKNHYAIRGKKFQQPSDFSLKEKLVFQNFFARISCPMPFYGSPSQKSK